MKKSLFKSLLAVVVSMFCLSQSAVAQVAVWGADMVIPIWDNGSAPHDNGLSGDETTIGGVAFHVANVSAPQLYIYQAKGECRSDKAVVICPGGGYRLVSMLYEGQRLGEWYAENGITAAVVKYRMPNGVKEAPFEDVVEAMRILKSKSEELGFDPSKVGVAGGSAGGHLAASVSTLTSAKDKPYFSVLFYPVISAEKALAHGGSFKNLLGDELERQKERYSLDKRVDKLTPPAFLLHCSDDKTVPAANSTRYYEALSRYSNKSALYIFPSGGHGWGNKDTFEYQKQWQALLLDWLNKLD